MALVDPGQPRIDDLLVELFLILETENLAGLLREHAGNAIERDVMVIGVEGGHRLDRHLPVSPQGERRQQPAVGTRRSVHGHHDGTFGAPAPGILDDQGVDIGAPDHALADRTQATALHGTQTECSQHQ